MTAATHTMRIAGTAPVSFECGGHETVLHAALQAGLGFPHECHSGGCGGCTYELLEGRIDERWADAPGLPPAARERGLHLACQTAPRSDCSIKLRLKPAYIAPVAPSHHRVRLLDARALSHDMRIFRFAADRPAEFIAGQYALLHLPGVAGARAYSMSNLPNGEGGEGVWEFIIKRTPEGEGTAVLFDRLVAGDVIGLDGPYGNAFLRADTPRDIVCIGGGSGLSPLLGILRAAAADARLSGRRLRLFYGARSPRDHGLDQLLADEPALRERLHTVLAISNPEPAPAWTGERGFTHEVVDRHLGDDAAQHDFYICGPPPMTDAVHKLLLLQRKVPSAQVRFDRFY